MNLSTVTKLNKDIHNVRKLTRRIEELKKQLIHQTKYNTNFSNDTVIKEELDFLRDLKIAVDEKKRSTINKTIVQLRDLFKMLPTTELHWNTFANTKYIKLYSDF